MIFFNTSIAQWEAYPWLAKAVVATDSETLITQYGLTHESLLAGLRAPGMAVLRSEIVPVSLTTDQQARLFEINNLTVPAQLQSPVAQYVEYGYLEQPKDPQGNVLSLGHTGLDAIAARPEVIEAARQYHVNLMLGKLAEQRWKIEIAGVRINGMFFGTTDREKALMACKAFAASQKPEIPVQYKVSEGFVNLTAQQLINLFLEAENYIQNCFSTEGALAFAIQSAEDPLSVDITQGWPSNDITADLNA